MQFKIQTFTNTCRHIGRISESTVTYPVLQNEGHVLRNNPHSIQLAELNSLVLKCIDFVQIQKICHDSIDLNSTYIMLQHWIRQALDAVSCDTLPLTWWRCVGVCQSIGDGTPLIWGSKACNESSTF